MRASRTWPLLLAAFVLSQCFQYVHSPRVKSPPRVQLHAARDDTGTDVKVGSVAETEEEMPAVEFDASFLGVIVLALPLIAIFAGRFE
mmetsp:Transcript_8934/g.21203  ORF Transcript_8934/g.21203 Transcript_8934/m.21203 type:complete len:88 (+) Transcript_8934:32-295(+)